MLPIAVARSSTGGVTQSQGIGAILGVFLPTVNALYSIAFGTYAKTAEPIEMPFSLMTRFGSRYHVLDGRPDPPKEMDNFGENVAAHCKVMGLSTVRFAKTAELFDMLFWKKTRVHPRNHVLDGGADPLGKGQFLAGAYPRFKKWGCGVRIMESARNKASKAPRWWGVRRGCPSPHRKRVWGGGYAPPQKLFQFLSSKWQVFVHSRS